MPSFGGFVAQRISAKIDWEKGTITPPRKAVLFNKQLINNDGLRVSAFAQESQLSFEQAQAEIQQLIQEWNSRLKMGGRVTIDRVGNLFFDQEHNLCFEQDRFFNLLLESFGLTSVRFVSESDVQARESHQTVTHVVKALELEQKQLNKEVEPTFVLSVDQAIVPAVEESKQATSGKTIELHSQKTSRVWRYVAAACLLPVAFYSVWLPVKTDVLESGVLSLNDFNPFHKHIPGKYNAKKGSYTFQIQEVRKQLDNIPQQVSVFSYEMDEDTYIPVSVKKIEPKPEVTTTVEVPLPETPVIQEKTVSSNNGELIVGSYLNRESASDLMKTLTSKGLTPHLIEKDGKIRLSAGSASDMKTIMPILNALNITPWVLK